MCIIHVVRQTANVSMPEPIGDMCGPERTYRVNLTIPVSNTYTRSYIVDFVLSFYRILVEDLWLKLLIVL